MAQFPLIDQASLVMIPGAYKEGKIYSQLPTDGSGDFTYTRGTDTATRVNEAGNIEKEYENTLLQSNNWAQSDSQYEITGGEAGYDGTNDAWLVNKLAAAYFSKDALVLTGVQTISFFAKAGSLDRIFVFIGGDAARFDLTNGTAVSAGGNPVSQNIELVSGTTDWYRCSIVLNKTSTQNLLIKPQNSSNQDVTGTIYIQDAQLNQGLVAYPYLETTTVPVYAGLTDNMPRLDYTDATCPSLLLEPSRTNLVGQSEYFGGSYWTIGGASFVSGLSSPEGLSNAYEFKEGTNAGAHFFYDNGFIIVNGTSYTMSVFVKYNGRQWFRLWGQFGNSNQQAYFDVQNGVTGSKDAGVVSGIEDYGNGWYRVYLTATSDGTAGRYRGYLAITDGNPSYQGDDTSGVYLYGATFEQGSYPTSYIPTYGSSVTRSEDSAITASSDLISTQAFTIFFEHKALGISGTSWAYRLDMSDGSDEIEFYVNVRSSGEGMNIYLGAGNGGYVFGNANNNGYTVGSTSKVALSYDGNRLAYFINGSLYNSATGVSFNDVNTTLTLQGSRNITNKQSIVFPTALTDSECIALTTI